MNTKHQFTLAALFVASLALSTFAQTSRFVPCNGTSITPCQGCAEVVSDDFPVFHWRHHVRG